MLGSSTTLWLTPSFIWSVRVKSPFTAHSVLHEMTDISSPWPGSLFTIVFSFCLPHSPPIFFFCLESQDFGETAFTTIMRFATVVATIARLLYSWHLSCQEYHSLFSSIWSELNSGDIVSRTQSGREKICWKQFALKLQRRDVQNQHLFI